jgi:hypothetical protein
VRAELLRVGLSTIFPLIGSRTSLVGTRAVGRGGEPVARCAVAGALARWSAVFSEMCSRKRNTRFTNTRGVFDILEISSAKTDVKRRSGRGLRRAGLAVYS